MGRISEFFRLQWQNLAEILSLFFWVIWGHLGSLFGPLGSFWVLTLHLVTAGGCFFSFFCRESRDYVLFGVEFCQKFWQKFLEILRILAEILRKKLATGASAGGIGI